MGKTVLMKTLETTPKPIKKAVLIKKRENATQGISNFQSEISLIGDITQEEIDEGQRIIDLIKKCKQSKKLQSKQRALQIQQERFTELDNKIKEMDAKGIDIEYPE